MALKAMRFMNLLLTGVLATIVAPEEPDGGSDPVGNDSYTPHAIAHSLRAGPAPISPPATRAGPIMATATQYGRTQERIQNGLLQAGQAPLMAGSFGFNSLR